VNDSLLVMLRLSCNAVVWLILSLLISACVDISVFPSAVLAAAILFLTKEYRT
jgi:type III secretory pathway component EscV